MESRKRTLVALVVIVGTILVIIIGAGLVLSRSSTVSPVPEEGAIKIIFISPTPTLSVPSSTENP